MQSMFEKCSNECVCVGVGMKVRMCGGVCGRGGGVWRGDCGCVLGMYWVLTGATMHAHSTTCSTNMLSTCRSSVTKKYNWQIINISVMPFCHWLAACTSHLCAPSSRYNIHLKGKNMLGLPLFYKLPQLDIVLLMTQLDVVLLVNKVDSALLVDSCWYYWWLRLILFY